MPQAFLPGNKAIHFAVARTWTKDAGEDLDRRRLARSVRADQSQQLAAFERKTHPIERDDFARLATEEASECACEAGVANGDAESLRQIVDENLRHRALMGKRARTL